MKTAAITLISILYLFNPNYVQTDKYSIIGEWKAPDMENSTIKVYKATDGFIYGKIIASDEAEWIEEIILKKVKYDVESKSWRGKIYSLKRNMTIAAELTLENSKKLKLVGTKFFMTKTFYWNK